MRLIGKPPINPILFYTGKISGYFTCLVMVLALLQRIVLERISHTLKDEIALAIFVVGWVFVIISTVNLGRSTRLGLPSDDTVLKTDGLYKISRNPIYVGLNLLSFASILYTRNLWIGVLGIYSIIIYHLIILGEEQFLEIRFGTVYMNYKKQVRRYL